MSSSSAQAASAASSSGRAPPGDAPGSELFLLRLLNSWLLLSVLLWPVLWLTAPRLHTLAGLSLVALLPARLALVAGSKLLARYLSVLPLAVAVMLIPLWLNGVRSPVLASVPLIILLAGWLLGRYLMRGLTLLFVLGVALYWYAETQAWLAYGPAVPGADSWAWALVWIFSALLTDILAWSLLANYAGNFAQLLDMQQQLAEAQQSAARAQLDLAAVLRFNEAIQRDSPLAIAVYAASGQCVEVNEAYANLFGTTRTILLGENFHYISAWRISGLLQDCLNALVHNTAQRRECSMRTAFGKEITLACRMLPVQLGGQRHLLVQFLNLSERQEIERSRRAALTETHYLQQALESVSATVSFKDKAGRYTYANQQACTELGYPLDEIVANSDDQFFTAALLADRQRNERRVLEQGERIASEQADVQPDTGATRYVWRVQSPLLKGGDIVGMCSIAIDITERRRIDDELQRAQQNLSAVLELNQTILQNSPLPMRVFSDSGDCVDVNEAYAELVGTSRENLLSKNFHEIGLWQTSGLADDCLRALVHKTEQRREVGVLTSSGKNLWLDSRILPIRMHGESHLLAQFVDLTDRKRFERQLQELAFDDALTGLPNRRLLLDRLQQALHNSKRQDSHGALVVIDLNKLTQLNERHGRDAGDQWLHQLAARLRQVLRQNDTVARVGAGEFAVLLESLGAEAGFAAAYVKIVADKIRLALGEEYLLGTLHYRGAVSLGSSLFLGDQQHPEQILQATESAMAETRRKRALLGSMMGRG